MRASPCRCLETRLRRTQCRRCRWRCRRYRSSSTGGILYRRQRRPTEAGSLTTICCTAPPAWRVAFHADPDVPIPSEKKKTWMNITIGSITNCLIVKSSANQSWARTGWYANEASQIIPERTTTGNWKYPHWYANEMQMRRIVLQSTFLFCFVFISPVNLNLPYANRMQMREIWPFIYLFIYLFILVPSGVYLFHFYDRLEIKFRRSLTNCWVN